MARWTRLLALSMAGVLAVTAGSPLAFAQTPPQYKKGGGGGVAKPPGTKPFAGKPNKGPPIAAAPSGRPSQHGGGHRGGNGNGAAIGIGVATGILATILAAQAAKAAAEGGPPPPVDYDDPMSRKCRQWDRLCEEEGVRWACRRLERDCN